MKQQEAKYDFYDVLIDPAGEFRRMSFAELREKIQNPNVLSIEDYKKLAGKQLSHKVEILQDVYRQPGDQRPTMMCHDTKTLFV